MIRLEIEAADAAEFNALLGGLLQAIGPPSGRHDSTAAAEEATENHITAGFAVARTVPIADAGPVAATEVMEQAAELMAETVKRRPGRPRKAQPNEGMTIDGTVNTAPVSGLFPSSPIEDVVTQIEMTPLLDLPALKDAYSLDEIRALAIDYVKAVATPEGGTVPDSQFARAVLGGMLSAFGVEKVQEVPEGERVKLAGLIHRLAALGRMPAPPAASFYVDIAKSF